MDLRKISLYLAWKLPPHYGESRKLFFIRQLRILAPQQYTNDEIDFIDRQSKGDDEKFYGMILQDLTNTSQRSFGEFITQLSLPEDVTMGEEKSSEAPIAKNKIDADKVVNQYIHNDLQSFFIKGLDGRAYDDLAFGAIKVLNERLKKYANSRWLMGLSENEAVNALFTRPDNVFGFDLGTDSGIAQKDGLKALLNGLFSYFRNPMGHGVLIDSKEDFIHILLFLSMLMKVLDNKGIR